MIAYLDKWICSFAYTLAYITIDIFLADMRAPLHNHFFVENFSLVKGHEDLGHRRNKVRMFDSYETFETSKERLLMLLAVYNLEMY
jgi:hypothetical protein